jgi:hypothetical protein
MGNGASRGQQLRTALVISAGLIALAGCAGAGEESVRTRSGPLDEEGPAVVVVRDPSSPGAERTQPASADAPVEDATRPTAALLQVVPKRARVLLPDSDGTP